MRGVQRGEKRVGQLEQQGGSPLAQRDLKCEVIQCSQTQRLCFSGSTFVVGLGVFEKEERLCHRNVLFQETPPAADKVLSGEGLAVAPSSISAQKEGKGESIGRPGPALRRSGLCPTGGRITFSKGFPEAKDEVVVLREGKEELVRIGLQGLGVGHAQHRHVLGRTGELSERRLGTPENHRECRAEQQQDDTHPEVKLCEGRRGCGVHAGRPSDRRSSGPSGQPSCAEMQ